METSLHRELKTLYAGDSAATEVRLGRYRIDVVHDGELIEIQHGSLAAIRDKVRHLLGEHRVRVVKPLIASKTLVKRSRKNGRVIERRASPKRCTRFDLFDELIYFTRVFPHERLTLEAVLVDVEEWRYPGHGRRRRWSAKDYQVEDQKLCGVRDIFRLETAADLAALLGCKLPTPFDTADIARGAGIKRHIAQRIAYCFRHMGTSRIVGKRGNSVLYELIEPLKKRRRAG
jgi:hypothetical protein